MKTSQNPIKKYKILFIIALFVRRYFLKLINRKSVKLSVEEKSILITLKKDGIVVIPNYFTLNECGLMKDEFDKYVENHSIYCIENENRIFGIERLSSKVAKIFSNDQTSFKVCEAYLGEEMTLQATMAAKIEFKEEIEYGSGGSWHRDSFSRQIKSIAYLTDMDDDNGPFMYIKGSHKFRNIIKVLLKLKRKKNNANNARYTKQDMKKALDILDEKIEYFPCSAGTLILADIRGLHTTRYLKGGFAYSIFNYYIAKTDDSKSSGIRKIADECVSIKN
ncbi:MAG: phytanoyl-CoA dioxygenase family protein [Gammaproteobacteria bacterium]|nr:phytanoyl-CoA dioxygenase family protein [Gammaproteobacteria bacterium]